MVKKVAIVIAIESLRTSVTLVVVLLFMHTATVNFRLGGRATLNGWVEVVKCTSDINMAAIFLREAVHIATQCVKEV